MAIKFEELHRNKIVVSPDFTDGATWYANWAYLYFDTWRWLVSTHRGDDFELDTLSDFAIIDRPSVFHTPEEYLSWLDANGIEIADHEREYIKKKQGQKEILFLRCLDGYAHPPYPGGYWCATRDDMDRYPKRFRTSGRYFTVVTDLDDGIFHHITDDLTQSNEVWEILGLIPDLTTQDLVDLGFEC